MTAPRCIARSSVAILTCYDGSSFLTGDIMSPETSQFLAQTGVPCLSKPFTLEMVREVVQRMLSEASRR